MHQCKCASMSACLFVCLYVYMSVRVFVMYVMYVLSEFLGKDQDSYETSLVNVKSEKCRVNDNEWMTIFPIIRRMCVFLVELLVRAVGCNFLQQKRVEKPRWMRHCTLRKELQLNYFYLNYGCRSLMAPMFNCGFRWTRRRWQKRTRAQKDVCWAAWARVLAPQHTTVEPGKPFNSKLWEHVPMISHVSVEVPSDWRTDSGHFRTQKMWSWPKSDFTCFHPRCYFSVSSTTIVKKSTQGGWRLLLFTPFMVQTRAQNWINHDKHSTIHYYLLFAHPQITTLRHMIRIWTRNEQQKWSKMAGVPLLLASKKLLASLPFLTKIYHNYSQLI